MASSVEQPCYTLISGTEDEELMSEQEMRTAFEKGNLDQKANALKACVKGMLRGEKYPMLLMHIIRFILPMKDHIIKKLLLLYFEIVPKTAEGKLLPQMILVCDAYRKVRISVDRTIIELTQIYNALIFLCSSDCVCRHRHASHVAAIPGITEKIYMGTVCYGRWALTVIGNTLYIFIY